MPAVYIPPMRRVYSSHIDSVGYDFGGAGSLHVRYSTGRHVVYDGVPADVAVGILSAPSVGAALHALVRGRFKHRYHNGRNPSA